MHTITARSIRRRLEKHGGLVPRPYRGPTVYNEETGKVERISPTKGGYYGNVAIKKGRRSNE